jgi:hypothetical protein
MTSAVDIKTHAVSPELIITPPFVGLEVYVQLYGHGIRKAPVIVKLIPRQHGYILIEYPRSPEI